MMNRDCKALTMILLLILFCGGSGQAQVSYDSFEAAGVYRMGADQAQINSRTTTIIADDRLTNKKGITLKNGVPAALDMEREEPDILFEFKAPVAGYYVMSTYAKTDEEGATLMEAATSKYESLFMKMEFDDQRATSRVIYVPWNRPRQTTGKFMLSGEAQVLKIWLPRGVRLDFVELKKYVAPAVPNEVEEYKPTVLPPKEHPRLWVNSQTLPLVKDRLESKEHSHIWKKVADEAKEPFEFEVDSTIEMSFDVELEKAAKLKAFYYLMEDDKMIGREAIDLMSSYLDVVSFGNILDITREMGRTIYTASLVYDWCYDLMTEDEKNEMVERLMRLSMDMECGWPPFKQSIVNGHGNEAQINRDLLAMSIAIYDEDPTPYQYTSYIILEQLVPMRAFEYQSPRHNQGVNYAAYRFAWEMHAAWLFYRMTGEPVFDNNIKGMGDYWHYMRRPDGQMLRDGDGFSAGKPGEFYYWNRPITMLMMYSYARDPLLKGEFQRQGGLPHNPVLYLLLNDPELMGNKSRESLPLTKDFGPVLGSMVARTGWDISMESDDVVAEVKGGGYHFGNHQHSDAGAIQVYYRGQQLGDLGIYKFYGTPYDYNFNKRSIAHSMMLAVDPDEKFLNTESNDGGTRLNQRFPRTPEEAMTDPWFDNGRVVSTAMGPQLKQPQFSYFKADLTAAYTSKMSDYTRSFCFLNLDRNDVPAAIILADDMTTSHENFQKYWQINTLNPPEIKEKQWRLYNQRNGKTGNTFVEMVKPGYNERKIEVFSGQEANSSFGYQYQVPSQVQPEASGHRIMVTPSQPSKRDRFLTVLQLTADDTPPLPVTTLETPQSDVVILADRVVSISNHSDLIRDSFAIEIPGSGNFQILLADLKPGYWNVQSDSGEIKFNVQVKAGENTIYFLAPAGRYQVQPGRLYGVKLLGEE